MRIKQLYSAFGWHLKGVLMKKYGLHPANDFSKPVLFLGMYGDAQITRALEWNNKVVVWLSGGDGAYLVTKSPLLDDVKKAKHITFITPSNFLAADLDKVGIPHLNLPLFSHPMDVFKPVPLGDSIYVYHPNSPVYCPKPIYKKIRKEFKNVPFIEARNHHTHPHKDIMNIYAKSFLGLRFTKHDGLSHTVCEMGLMGRRMVCNLNAPNCLNYNSEDEILLNIEQAIRERHIYRGAYLSIAQEMYRYLDVGDSFLDV